MNNKVVTILAFAMGVATGSLLTWKYLKDFYEEIAQEEIDSVKEVFLKREKENIAEEPKMKIAACYENGASSIRKQELADYAEILKEQEYNKKSDEDSVKPYVISPEEFGEFDEYEKISLTYYSNNHVLADENDEIIDDIEETVGVESLAHFGEYEDDSVFVRNDKRKCDYEILWDSKSYPGAITHDPSNRTEEK